MSRSEEKDSFTNPFSQIGELDRDYVNRRRDNVFHLVSSPLVGVYMRKKPARPPRDPASKTGISGGGLARFQPVSSPFPARFQPVSSPFPYKHFHTFLYVCQLTGISGVRAGFTQPGVAGSYKHPLRTASDNSSIFLRFLEGK